ncbi:hypothetical protein [Adhaeretor mobilis]|uniref:Uncharacterized protein n=1 Tax=Adhaeretor mobilis TaxID=1930276 RepID=A0A517MQQ1_9BACT|nr:hypothetical protein [Adhaeretor mobilis]QDS97211.1 hypothetical protein HG15A2_04710 [Adhaeretor mobilis]
MRPQQEAAQQEDIPFQKNQAWRGGFSSSTVLTGTIVLISLLLIVAVAGVGIVPLA